MPDYGNNTKHRRSDEHRDAVLRKTGFWGQLFDNHIRLIAALATVAVLLLLFFGIEWMARGGWKNGRDSYTGDELTVMYLHGLGEKTTPVTWSDLDGYSYKTVSMNESDDGVYVLRRYSVEGGELTLTVGGFTDGTAYTGELEYATVTHADDFNFSFSLLGDGDFLTYLDGFERAD